MTKIEIGKTIKDRRKFLDITQKELSEIAELGLRSFIDIETGNGNPTIDQINKVASVLGLEIKIEIKQNE